MAYVLGIDLGTSCAAAAISRAGGGTEVVALRVDTPGVPTVLYVADDGTMLVGAAAEPLMLSDPDHVFRGFLHHLDEPSSPDPLCSPATLTARLVHWIVGAVTEQEGDPPQQITLAHPVSWGPGEYGVLQQALIEFGLAGVLLMPTSLAAAAYAAEVGGAAGADAAAGDVLAVYDLGATFSVSLLRCASDDFAVLGEPQVLADGGGARFDELVLARVLDELGDQVASADLDDQAMLAGMAALLADCVTAREALTTRSVVTIPVSLPGLDARVRLSGDELETLIDPTLRATVDSVRAAISSVGLRPADVSKVLVTGGCAGMPSVARLLMTELGRPFVVLTDPELAAARGAALMAARPGHREPVVVPPLPAAPDDLADGLPTEPIPGLPIPMEPIPAAPIPAAPIPARPIPEDRISAIPGDRMSAIPGDRISAGAWPEPASANVTADTAAFPRVSAHQPAAGRHFRPRRRILLAVAAGILSVTTVVLPLTLWRAPDSGAAPSAADRDPSQGKPVPVHKDTTTPPTRAVTASTTTGMPTSPARPLAIGPTASRPAPQPLVVRPLLASPSPAPDPRTTTRPRTTTTVPPRPDPTSTTSSTPPPPTSSSTTTTTTTTTTPPPESSSSMPPSDRPTPPS